MLFANGAHSQHQSGRKPSPLKGRLWSSVGPLPVWACSAPIPTPVGLYSLSEDNAPQAQRGGGRLPGGPAGPLVHRLKRQNTILLFLSG